jgi:hypothetical protein
MKPILNRPHIVTLRGVFFATLPCIYADQLTTVIDGIFNKPHGAAAFKRTYL